MFGRKKPQPARTCPEGHVLEESWEQCPYCAAGRAKEESKRAIVVPKPTTAERVLAGWLVALDGEQAGEDFRLREGRNVLGKGDRCDVLVRDPQVSERHAIVEYRVSAETWTVEDLESKHGTWRNGKRLPAGDAVPLADGDRLRLGRTELFFRAFAPAGRPGAR